MNCVSAVRRALNMKKVGHSGTLDTGASGVMVICTGKCTKLCDFFMQKDKTYVAQATFGIATATCDSFGETTQTIECDVSESELLTVLPSFTGKIEQQPPIYSNVFVDGKRLYKYAVAGQEVEIPTREVTVYSLELLEKVDKNVYSLKINCSKGTYIRSLVRDIGAKLGVPAHMSALVRTGGGGFSIDECVTIEEMKEMAEKSDFSFVIPRERFVTDET